MYKYTEKLLCRNLISFYSVDIICGEFSPFSLYKLCHFVIINEIMYTIISLYVEDEHYVEFIT